MASILVSRKGLAPVSCKVSHLATPGSWSSYPHLDDVDVYVFQEPGTVIHEYGDGLPDERFRRHRTINQNSSSPR